MRALLDTNILIHREGHVVVNDDIGHLFYWLDKLRYEKVVHPVSIEELKKHKDAKTVRTITTKVSQYNVLKTLSKDKPEVQKVRLTDKTENDRNDTNLVSELFNNRVDIVISEDKGVHAKARALGISDQVFTIDSFLEKCIAENPNLKDYKVLSVQKTYFGNVNLSDPFFDSFREDYKEFNTWFEKKSDEECYVCAVDGAIQAFLYVKMEGKAEKYPDITPSFEPKKRLKVGTLKVAFSGHRLGERFLRIIFDNALTAGVEEIYVTLFTKRLEQERLSRLLQEWGFRPWGKKVTQNGTEDVYVRVFAPDRSLKTPKQNFPFLNKDTRYFLVPIYPAYHTSLLPDSILNTESPEAFQENKPHMNAIQKVYISRSIRNDLRMGDILLFYRTKDRGPALYTSVVTTVGVVESVVTNITSQEEFIRLCRKRSVFSNEDLAAHWNYSARKPFIVNFLFVFSLLKRLNLEALIKLGVIEDQDSAPRGFTEITRAQFGKVMRKAGASESYFFD